jgi:hypothetical protein
LEFIRDPLRFRVSPLFLHQREQLKQQLITATDHTSCPQQRITTADYDFTQQSFSFLSSPEV